MTPLGQYPRGVCDARTACTRFSHRYLRTSLPVGIFNKSFFQNWMLFHLRRNLRRLFTFVEPVSRCLEAEGAD